MRIAQIETKHQGDSFEKRKEEEVIDSLAGIHIHLPLIQALPIPCTPIPPSPIIKH